MQRPSCVTSFGERTDSDAHHEERSRDNEERAALPGQVLGIFKVSTLPEEANLLHFSGRQGCRFMTICHLARGPGIPDRRFNRQRFVAAPSRVPVDVQA